MGTYKGIQGYSVQTLGSDPTVADVVGQLWYNTSSNTWKISIQGAAAWASGGNMNTTREMGAGMGTQTAAIYAGGSPTTTGPTETYNGSTWTETGDTNTDRYGMGGAGTTTAAIIISGSPPVTTNCETFNGSAWTEVANVQSGRLTGSSASAGTTTATLFYGGGYGATQLNLSETWNGTSWSEGNNLNTARFSATGGGTTTAAIMGPGGNTPNVKKDETETYDGTSWSEQADANTARSATGYCGGAMTSTAALIAGGKSPAFSPIYATVLAESWDGTSWTEVTALPAARSEGCIMGTSALGLYAAGTTPGPGTNTSFEYDSSPIAAQTVTTS